MPFNDISKYVDKHSLIYNALKYHNENDIVISTPHGTILPQREGDKAIMHLAVTKYNERATLRAINRVRMAFGVNHLSDICSANGSTLNTHIFYNHNRLISPKTHMIGQVNTKLIDMIYLNGGIFSEISSATIITLYLHP